MKIVTPGVLRRIATKIDTLNDDGNNDNDDNDDNDKGVRFALMISMNHQLEHPQTHQQRRFRCSQLLASVDLWLEHPACL